MYRAGMMTALVFLLLSTACSKENSEEIGYSFMTTVEDGTETAVTRGGPRYRGELFLYEEALLLQEDPANEESLLNRPGMITADERGYFYVIDSGDACIAVFDPAGRFLRRIGRSGQGPGEFSRLSNLQVHNGIIHVYDAQLNRTTRFRTGGTLLDMTTVPGGVIDRRQGIVRDMHILDDGTMLLTQSLMSEDDLGQFSQMRVLALSTAHDTLWSIDTPVMQTSQTTTLPSGGMLSFSMPFSGMAVIHIHPIHGIIVSDGLEPELLWYGTTGRLTRKVRIELEPVPLTGEDLAKTRARFQKQIEDARESGQTMMAEFYEAELKAMKMPDCRPFWRQVVVSDRGYLWLQIVEHSADREAAGGGYLYRVLSPAGEYLGDTRVPYGLRFTLTGDRLLCTWTPPDTDEYQLLVGRIVPLIEGLEYP